ncbi:uncharacterized protein LOC144744956 [Ciona intestinalis]
MFESASTENPGIQCDHLDAVGQAELAEIKELDLFFLMKLKESHAISENSVKRCESALLESVHNKAPLVVYADFAALGYGCRTHYYSVYCTEHSYYSALQRLRLSFDVELGEWACQCPLSGFNKTCLHATLVKWYMLQHQPTLFDVVRRPVNITAEMEFELVYLLEHKKIPARIPQCILEEKKPGGTLIPSEGICPGCGHDLILQNEKSSTVYGVGSVWKGEENSFNVRVCGKECSQCGLRVRFQEFESGIHNFNDRIMVTIKLCHLLLKGVENHVSIESNLKMHFDSENIPFSALRNAALHFLALQDHSYDFTCVKCGQDPPIVIADGNWRNTCKINVEALSKSNSFSDHVNVSNMWENYAKEIVARGIYGASDNPFKVNVKYDMIAPWISKNSRRNELVPNTEHRKGLVLAEQPAESIKSSAVSYEEILEAVNNPQVSYI